MWNVIVSFLCAGFLVVYGLGVIGWPFDATAGVGFLEKRSPATRRMLGVVLILIGLIVAAMQVSDLATG